MSKKKKGSRIALCVFLICIAVLVGYFVKTHHDGVKISKLSVKYSLLDLYEQNPDLVGWIRIPDTKISYPVMGTEDYLHKNFEGEYEYRGTPFVMSDWTEESRNSMIFGHNMWVEKTVFNPLHKYEVKDHWEKHQKAEFFVIRGKDSDPYVEKRTYQIHAVDKLNVDSNLYRMAQYFDNDLMPIRDLFDAANKGSLYDTGVKWTGGDELTLCTCSYHIKGNRDAGRLLVFGTRINTEKKDICD